MHTENAIDIAEVYRKIVEMYATDGPLPAVVEVPAGFEHAAVYEVPAIILRAWAESAGSGPSDFHAFTAAVETSDLPEGMADAVMEAAMDTYRVGPEAMSMVLDDGARDPLTGSSLPTLREALDRLRREPIRDIQAPSVMAILNAVAALTGNDDFDGDLPRPVGVIDESMIPAPGN